MSYSMLSLDLPMRLVLAILNICPMYRPLKGGRQRGSPVLGAGYELLHCLASHGPLRN